MLALLCEYLNNWFDECCKKEIGTITIADGALSIRNSAITFPNGQYFRIVGSTFNDGVYRWPVSNGVLYNEVFDGAVWEMKIPESFVELSREIKEWQNKYGGYDSPAMSPYNSESFAGYSYSKQTGSTADGEAPTSWQAAYKSRLNMWRKL